MVVCTDCEYSSSELVWILFTIYNAFTDTTLEYEEKKCKVLNLFQLYLVECIDLFRPWKLDVTECGSYHFLTMIFTLNGYSVNMVVYFDGHGYVLLNQGSCRIKYDNNKRVTESVVQQLLMSSKDNHKSCDLKMNMLYAYDKKCDKVVAECNFDRCPKITILSPKKCKNVSKCTILRFDVLDISELDSYEYVVLVDDVEYIRLSEVIPITVYFKNHGKHQIEVKLWDSCMMKYVSAACVDVKVEDKCTTDTTCTTNTCTTTTCPTDTTCTTSTCTTSTSCEPCKKKGHCDDTTSTSCEPCKKKGHCDDTTTSTSCEPCKKNGHCDDTTTSTTCEPCKNGHCDDTTSTCSTSTCSLSEKNVKVITYRSETTDN
jgi:hypothetical protein